MIKRTQVTRFGFDREKFQILLVQKGIAKSELARRIGKSAGAISQWCSGVTNPTERTLYAVAKALKVKPAELLIQEGGVDV